MRCFVCIKLHACHNIPQLLRLEGIARAPCAGVGNMGKGKTEVKVRACSVTEEQLTVLVKQHICLIEEQCKMQGGIEDFIKNNMPFLLPLAQRTPRVRWKFIHDVVKSAFGMSPPPKPAKKQKVAISPMTVFSSQEVESELADAPAAAPKEEGEEGGGRGRGRKGKGEEGTEPNPFVRGPMQSCTF